MLAIFQLPVTSVNEKGMRQLTMMPPQTSNNIRKGNWISVSGYDLCYTCLLHIAESRVRKEKRQQALFSWLTLQFNTKTQETPTFQRADLTRCVYLYCDVIFLNITVQIEHQSKCTTEPLFTRKFSCPKELQ